MSRTPSSFKFKRLMTHSELPVQLDLSSNSTTVQQMDRNGRKAYIKAYKDKIGLKGRWYMSEKLSGFKVLWNGREFLDKTLRPVPHIPLSILKVMLKGIPLEGVLINFSPSIRGPVSWEKVKFIIYDFPLPNTSFENRWNRALKWTAIAQSPVCQLHTFTVLQNIETEFYKVNDLYTSVLDKGGKGVMLMEANSLYLPKQVTTLLSYKQDIYGSARIVGYREGMQKWYKYLGKFKCETENGKFFYCSQGIPDEIRYAFHFDRTVLTSIDNPENVPLIGDTLYYTSASMIKNDTVPRDAVFKDFEKTGRDKKPN